MKYNIDEIKDTILYRNDEEKKTAYRKCIENAMRNDKFLRSFTVEELEKKFYSSDEPKDDNRVKCTLYDYIVLDEGTRLFELACQKYGYKLWNGNAWHNKTCKRNCPLADFCERNTVEINGERLCRGQVYSRDISCEDLPQDTLIYRQDGSIYITKERGDQTFGAFFEFSLDIFYFGWEKKGGSQIMGGNVILKLYKEVLNVSTKH